MANDFRTFFTSEAFTRVSVNVTFVCVEPRGRFSRPVNVFWFMNVSLRILAFPVSSRTGIWSFPFSAGTAFDDLWVISLPRTPAGQGRACLHSSVQPVSWRWLPSCHGRLWRAGSSSFLASPLLVFHFLPFFSAFCHPFVQSFEQLFGTVVTENGTVIPIAVCETFFQAIGLKKRAPPQC